MSHLQQVETAQTQLIGTEIGVSDWITIDQAMINQFAKVTRDEQWIHVDPERATRDAPFGGTIAHGFLTLSLASKFANDCLPPMPKQRMGLNYGLNKVRLLSPVTVQSQVRGRFVLQAVTARHGNELLRDIQLIVEVRGQEKPALVADWLSLLIFESDPCLPANPERDGEARETA